MKSKVISMHASTLKKMHSLKKMKSEWGKRCVEPEQACSSYFAWKIFDKTGNIPNLDEVLDVSLGKIKYKAGSD